jgi:UDP-N-acetylmuramate-alanine ligase
MVAYGLVDQAPQRVGGYARKRWPNALPRPPVRGDSLGRVTAMDQAGTTVEIHGLDPLAGPITVRLSTAGAPQCSQCAGRRRGLQRQGIDPEAIAAGLRSFAGVSRRLERKGGPPASSCTTTTATRRRDLATIDAVRQREPGRRVWAVYEPLTYHRTAALLDGFAAALATADAVAVADIWAGRDPDTTISSAGTLADAVAARAPGIPVIAPGSVETTADVLATAVEPGDVVLVMGGGQSYRIGERLLERLGEWR